MSLFKTIIRVYAIAWGGKFIGKGQEGIAYLTITDPSGKELLSKQPINSGGGGDGSGDTPKIMSPRNISWGTPVINDDAYNYTFGYNPAGPEQLTFTVEVYHYGKRMATASTQQVVWPGLTLIGNTSVVVVLPGLLSSVVMPQNPLLFYLNMQSTISANVYMMCGCMIDNHFWPGSAFQVNAVITDVNGNILETVPLSWSAPATFSGTWYPKFTGQFFVQSFVVETTNGNTACSAKAEARVLALEEKS